jgi:NitT/TauT family transport system permease protein
MAVKRILGIAVKWLPPLLVAAVVIGLWQGLIVALHVQQFLLPRPTAIASTFWTDRHELWPAGWNTYREALAGFAIGSGLGILAATFVGRFRRVGGALMPVFIAASAVPIIAFAPIAGQWFGDISSHSKMAIAAALCFFPVVINTLRGLQSASPRQIELMRSYAAGELTIWRRVRVPTALPFAFAGLKIASVLAMIGAIVGEFFGGTLDHLGVLINNDANTFDFVQAWAGILVASILGIALYLAVVVVERGVLRWAPQGQGS